MNSRIFVWKIKDAWKLKYRDDIFIEYLLPCNNAHL